MTQPNQHEDEEVWQLLNEFIRLIPAEGIGEARNALEEKLQQLITQKQLEARVDEVRNIIPNKHAKIVTKIGGQPLTPSERIAELKAELTKQEGR
jgi:hypothetical protein